jgi:hypothetical protein
MGCGMGVLWGGPALQILTYFFFVHPNFARFFRHLPNRNLSHRHYICPSKFTVSLSLVCPLYVPSSDFSAKKYLPTVQVSTDPPCLSHPGSTLSVLSVSSCLPLVLVCIYLQCCFSCLACSSSEVLVLSFSSDADP